MDYEVRFKSSVWRALLKVEQKTQNRLKEAIWSLADNPRPPGCRKLRGYAGYYRIRVGDYRVIYDIQDEVLVVLVLKIGRREDVYRGI